MGGPVKRFSGILFVVDGQFVSYVSVKSIGPIFSGQTVQICLTHEDWTKKLSRNVGKQLPTYAFHIPEQQRLQISSSTAMKAICKR